jgi:hypothetical protein
MHPHPSNRLVASMFVLILVNYKFWLKHLIIHSQDGEHVYKMVFGETLQKGQKLTLTMRFQSLLNEKYFGNKLHAQSFEYLTH